MTTSATDVIPPAHEAAGICTAPCRADELNRHHARAQGRDLQCDSEGRGTTEWPATAGHSLHAARDEADDALVYSNLGDGRVLVFWLLLLATQLATALWLGIVVLLAKMPVLSRVSGPAPRAKGESAHLLADAWSSLTLSTTVDAVAVLATFNGPVIRRFHYAVSQRIMILASILSFLLSSWNEKASFVARYPVESVAVACVLYALFSLLLDGFEKKMHASDADCSWRRLSQYSQRFCRAQSTWGRALTHSAVIAAVGLFLTALIPAPWSSVIPVVQILFEAVYLSTLRIKKTPQYILLSSPPFFANICVLWGVAPLRSSPRISIRPWSFLALFLAGRVLLDMHLRTVLKWRHELQWTREEVLPSTRRLLGVCAAMLLFENLGLRVVTYIKLIMIPAIFGAASVGFTSLAAHSIAVRVPAHR
ncbi:hypothetical protein MANI_028202 [Metarhizium anisopliae]